MKRNPMKWVCMFGAATVLVSCNIDMPKSETSSFETITIEKSDIVMPVKFSAKLSGLSDVTITPQVSGQMMKICVSEGQVVQKGTTLFLIDSRNAQHELEAAQANLQAAQANLLAAEAQANSAKLEYESNKNLFDKKIVSSYMLDNSLNSYKQAQAAVSQAKAAISQAQASVNRAKVNLGFCTIKSPVDGVIGEIPVGDGEQVSPGTILTVVSGNMEMSAEFSIPETVIEAAYAKGYDGNIEEALKKFPDVSFVMKNGTEYPLKGRISTVNGVVNAATGSISCKATFPNPDGMLYSGIQGTIVIPIAKKDVMVIPQNSIIRLQDKSLVYKVKADSTATAVTVTTQASGSGQDIIVTSGLKVGDKIVTVGANNVQEGQKVLF